MKTLYPHNLMLDPAQMKRVGRIAKKRRTTLSSIVREAIDLFLAAQEEEKDRV